MCLDRAREPEAATRKVLLRCLDHPIDLVVPSAAALRTPLRIRNRDGSRVEERVADTRLGDPVVPSDVLMRPISNSSRKGQRMCRKHLARHRIGLSWDIGPSTSTIASRSGALELISLVRRHRPRGSRVGNAGLQSRPVRMGVLRTSGRGVKFKFSRVSRLPEEGRIRDRVIGHPLPYSAIVKIGEVACAALPRNKDEGSGSRPGRNRGSGPWRGSSSPAERISSPS